MSDEDAFLSGIAAERADRTRLLVFADWLADRSDPREEFVRVHARLLDMDGTEAEFAAENTCWKGWVGGTPFYDPTPSRLSERWLDSLVRVCTTRAADEYRANGRAPEPARATMTEYADVDHIHRGEKSLTLYRGAPGDYPTPFEFVSETLLTVLWSDPFRASGAKALAGCNPLTCGRFWRTWHELCSGLLVPPPDPDVGAGNRFLGAQSIPGDWNNWGIVATYQRDYFALFWSTTA